MSTEVVLMKKTYRILSMLLSLVLLFSLMAANASAEGEDIFLPVGPGVFLTVAEPVFEGSGTEGNGLQSAPEGSESTLPVEGIEGSPVEGGEGIEGATAEGSYETPEEQTPGEASPTAEEPPLVCKVSLVYHGDEGETPEDFSSPYPMQDLMDPKRELRIEPPLGWYVSGLCLTDGSDAAANEALMGKMHADPASTAVSLVFSELTAEKANRTALTATITRATALEANMF